MQSSQSVTFDEVGFLGHGVNAKVVIVDPSKITTIIKGPRVTTISKVHIFLGFIWYYRKFVRVFS